MATQPSGTVTLLFSDIEGSTRLLERLGTETYAELLEHHRRLLREVFARHDGYEVDTEGDAFFVTFARAGDAVTAAEEAQQALDAATWAESVEVRVRMGLHTGEPLVVGANYVGMDVHRAARIMAAGYGGQVLLSQATRVLVDGRDLTDLGDHRLKDFDEPVRLFQVGASDFPPLKTLNNTNLPVAASTFVGRERELAEVTSLLRNGGGRLATLTGPGGSGKTRLALEAAGDLVGDYEGGVFWIGLASLREPGLVVEMIERTLGAKSGLAERIGDRTLLLLLDNFEHVIDAAVELSVLLGACRNLRLLVTSRELLRLQGEVEYQVPPLARNEAEDLFCARSGLPHDDEIADLCRRLDDLPLAVELAAARTAVLSPAQISERLSQRLDLFRGGRDADPRQRTLRATIEWSYELLSEPERQLFSRLSVFAGGCTYEAAEEIVAADVDALQSLVDKSLVRRTGGRFWMLETIGELSRERLEASGEAEEIGRRHADHFRDMAEQAEPALKGAEQPAWLQRLEDDHDNLRRSLDWFFDHGENELALRLAGDLWLFWYMHGHVSEARRWLRRALEAGPDEPSDARSTALDGAGYLANEQGEREEAISLLMASLSDAKRAGATSAAAIAAAHVCGVLTYSDPRAALAAGEEAVALAREAGDDYVIAVALNNLGAPTMALGENEQATAYIEESLALRRRIGDVSRIALSLCNVADMALLKGDVARAATLLAEAAEIATAIGDKRHISFAHSGLAWVAYRERRWEDADAHARESLRLGQELGMKTLVVQEIYCLAGTAAARGEPARAARLAAVAELHQSLFGPEEAAFAELHREAIEGAKAACDPGTWERAWSAGTALSLEDAATYALSSA